LQNGLSGYSDHCCDDQVAVNHKNGRRDVEFSFALPQTSNICKQRGQRFERTHLPCLDTDMLFPAADPALRGKPKLMSRKKHLVAQLTRGKSLF